MTSASTSTLRALTCVFLSLASLSVPAADFLVQPTGQATGNTCQAYSLAVALAFKRDPNFKVDTAAQLRAVEQAIRAEIVRAAAGAPVSHAHIVKGFQAYTANKYKLTMKAFPVAEIGDKVKVRTGVSSQAATPPSFLLGQVVKDVLLASATKIGNDAYKDGHIFAMLGMDGPPNSNQQFLLLNSALHIKPNQPIQCVDGVPDDPGNYTALLSWKRSGDIAFKPDAAGKVLVWQID